VLCRAGRKTSRYFTDFVALLVRDNNCAGQTRAVRKKFTTRFPYLRPVVIMDIFKQRLRRFRAYTTYRSQMSDFSNKIVFSFNDIYVPRSFPYIDIPRTVPTFVHDNCVYWWSYAVKMTKLLLKQTEMIARNILTVYIVRLLR